MSTKNIENPINSAVEILQHDIDALTGFQCFDVADSYGDADSMYATGATKVVAMFQTVTDSGPVVDTDAMAAAICNDLNDRYPLVDCPEGSDLVKKYGRVKEAYQRAGKKVFPVTIEGKKTTYNGLIKLSFNLDGKKTDRPEDRKRTVKVELLTAVQVETVASQKAESDELAKSQKEAKKALKEKQEAQSRGTASAADQLKVMQQYMAEQFGLDKEREVISLWLADLNANVSDDIGEVTEGLSQDSIDKLEAA